MRLTTLPLGQSHTRPRKHYSGGSAGLLDGRTDGEAGNRTNYSPVRAGTGADLGNEKK